MNIEQLTDYVSRINSAYEEEDSEQAERLLDDATYAFLETIALGKCDSPARMSNLLISLYERKMGNA
jgi:hypothetical protein